MDATAIEKLKTAFPYADFAEVLDAVVLEVPVEKLHGTLAKLTKYPDMA